MLGENYPEESVTKIQLLREFSAVEWHMIGHVQSRKAQLVAQNFNLLHSLDGLKLASRLNRFCEETGRILPTLLEFNVGEEQSKSGWPAWDETRWPELVNDVSAILVLSHLQVRGLMTMPPLGESAEYSRTFFQKIKRLQVFLAERFPQTDFSELSMGTSTDYEVAAGGGGALVRAGDAKVRPRKNKNKE